MLNTYQSRIEEIYNRHFQEIAGANFTLREIDIIVCIVHNRGEKKIGELLSISYRTVGAHLRNIRSKFGCVSREDIIDAVEKSGKLQYVRQYYCYLVSELLLNKTLRRIGKIVNNSGINCSADFNNIIDEENILWKQIQQHLTLANISIPEANKSDKAACHLWAISQLSDINKLPNNKKQAVNNNVSNNIALLFDQKADPSTFNKMPYVNFSDTNNYYFSMLSLVEKIICKPEVKQITAEFQVEYQKLQDSWTGTSVDTKLGNNSYKFTSKVSIFIITLLIISLTTAFWWFWPKNKVDVAEANQEFAKFIESYSFEHVGVAEGLKQNFSLLERIDNVVANLDHRNMLNYFKSDKSSPGELLNYLYSLNAIGMNLLYNEYNEKKARKILQIAKTGVESYINKKCSVEIDFNRSSPEEIYIELDVIDGFPAAYAKILYLLGRTYTYSDEDKRIIPPISQADFEDVTQFYNVAAYFGGKIKIFEGFLSIRSGIEMVRLLKIKDYIKNGDHYRATKQIINSINSFEELKKDRNQYVLDYRPGKHQFKTIIPADDNFNQVFISKQIVELYAMLVKITAVGDQRSQYVEKISSYFVGDKDIQGILDELKGVPLKVVAAMYNSLGDILLQFIGQDINFNKFKEQLEKKLNITTENELEFVKQVFNLAKTKSRNTYYTKVDSYDGLIRVYEKMLEVKNIGEQKAQDLKEYLNELKKKRDALKKQLEAKSLR